MVQFVYFWGDFPIWGVAIAIVFLINELLSTKKIDNF